MKGLTIGRLVLYIDEKGNAVPAIIVNVVDKKEKTVNLQAFLDENAVKYVSNVVHAEKTAEGEVPNSWRFQEIE